MQRAHAHLANPKNLTGVWFVFHNSARHVKNDSDKHRLMETVYETVENFRCAICHNDALAYLASHPVDPYWTRINEYGEDVGLFEYFWEFHNYVNRKLGKPILEWDEAYALYYGEVSKCEECSRKTTPRFRLSG